MRLICSSCDAQYEIDSALIPATGRDVQCSNCGATWFQEPEDRLKLTSDLASPEPATESVPSGDGLGAETAAFFSKESPAASTPPPAPQVDVQEDTDLAVAEREDAVEDGDLHTEADAQPNRPELDAAVLGILKAEAEREIAARRAAEAGTMESQPDLGLGEPDIEVDPIGARTRKLRGLDEEEDAPAENAARKALLPDVDEINSTLTATSEREIPQRIEETYYEVAQRRRSGFRLGFSMVMLLAAAAIFLYLFSPQIAEAVPALQPTLAAYVDRVNAIRTTVDSQLESSINTLTTFLVELSS